VAKRPADGLLTFRDLADYVESSVRSYSLQCGKVQVPYDAGEAAGDFSIARAVGEILARSGRYRRNLSL
jgi:hypothetical protein